ncbi:MAG: hypothetical protein VX699_04330, partial [Myxococcota bacterium]|nr:hypothetical protein [Myxococcota bacterium]
MENYLSQAYVLGLFSESGRWFAAVEDKMASARSQGAPVVKELGELLSEVGAQEEGLGVSRRRVAALMAQIAEGNATLATRHQRAASLRLRADEIKEKMTRVGRHDSGYGHMRRERAKVLVGLEDSGVETEALQREIEGLRGGVKELEAEIKRGSGELKTLRSRLDELQGIFPDPGLFVELFEARVGLAHCNLYLGEDVDAWRGEILRAINGLVDLHRDLSAGKYRVDRNSEYLGGRSSATGDAMYAAVALGEWELARDLFELVCEPDLYFHHIFEVFRCWCLGLFLSDRKGELKELLDEHQFSEGLRDGYSRCFRGLVESDEAGVQIA